MFCQMTKMMDILEDYFWYRKHTYLRLDGSASIADRRDMVNDFQSEVCDEFSSSSFLRPDQRPGL